MICDTDHPNCWERSSVVSFTTVPLVFLCQKSFGYSFHQLRNIRIMSTIGDGSDTSQFDPGKGPRPLILCGPSGSGKSTLLKRLLSEFDSAFGFSVSHTTRKPREGEVDGRDYHFVNDPEEMKAAVSRGEFLESAVFSGNMYGTSKSAVHAVCSKGKICVLDIDVQGVQQVCKQNLDPPPLLVFIRPPSLEVLEERLRLRATETEESLSRRLETARSELEYGESPGNFDLVLVNDVIDKAYEELKEFILPEISKLKENYPDQTGKLGN